MPEKADRSSGPDRQHPEVENGGVEGLTGVGGTAVAVATEVDGTHVVAEFGDPRCQLVEHAAVVVGAVGHEHDRCRRIAPLPDAEPDAVDLDEGRPVGLGECGHVRGG